MKKKITCRVFDSRKETIEWINSQNLNKEDIINICEWNYCYFSITVWYWTNE